MNTIHAAVVGLTPDGIRNSIPHEFHSLPRVGDWIEVASILPSDESIDYRAKVKFDMFDPTVTAVEHHFVEVVRVLWVPGDSPLLPDNDVMFEPNTSYPIIKVQPIKI